MAVAGSRWAGSVAMLIGRKWFLGSDHPDPEQRIGVQWNPS